LRATALLGLVLLAAIVLATAGGAGRARLVAIALVAGVTVFAATLLAPAAALALRGTDGRSLLGALALVAAPPAAVAVGFGTGAWHDESLTPLGSPARRRCAGWR
jgi:hypothetical protein